VVPRADAPDFPDALCAIIDKEEIDLVFVGADAETIYLARLREAIVARTGTVVLVADPDVVERSHDKWLTAQWFTQQKFPHPVTVRADDRAGVLELSARFGRIVVKPRFGFASRGIIATKPAEIMAAAERLGANGIVQEHIGNDDNEFTGAVLCDRTNAGGALKQFNLDNISVTSPSNPSAGFRLEGTDRRRAHG
jgi:glutathione synthase/RimK-type ligase-like ATP-grasp enzyme